MVSFSTAAELHVSTISSDDNPSALNKPIPIPEAASDHLDAVNAELSAPGDKVETFRVITFTLAPGEITVRREESLTIDDLRNVENADHFIQCEVLFHS